MDGRRPLAGDLLRFMAPLSPSSSTRVEMWTAMGIPNLISSWPPPLRHYHHHRVNLLQSSSAIPIILILSSYNDPPPKLSGNNKSRTGILLRTRLRICYEIWWHKEASERASEIRELLGIIILFIIRFRTRRWRRRGWSSGDDIKRQCDRLGYGAGSAVNEYSEFEPKNACVILDRSNPIIYPTILMWSTMCTYNLAKNAPPSLHSTVVGTHISVFFLASRWACHTCSTYILSSVLCVDGRKSKIKTKVVNHVCE